MSLEGAVQGGSRDSLLSPAKKLAGDPHWDGKWVSRC